MTAPAPTSATMPLADRLALPALLLGATGIAFAPIFVRLSEVGPVSTAFWRVAIAMPVLWLWMAWTDRRRPATSIRRKPRGARDLALLSLPGWFFAGDLGFWHLAIDLTSVANSTLLANFAPVFVTLFSWALFRTRVSATFLVGMTLALAGMVVLMGESLTISDSQLLGDGLGVITAVWYAGYIVAVGRLRETFDTATIMAWSAVSNTLALLVAALLLPAVFWPATPWAWGVLVALALVSHVGGQSLIAYALAHLPARFGSVSLLWQPACAAVLAWLLLEEPLSAWQGVGGLVILTGIVIARRGSRRRLTGAPSTT